jgi:hypothetical protein
MVIYSRLKEWPCTQVGHFKSVRFLCESDPLGSIGAAFHLASSPFGGASDSGWLSGRTESDMLHFDTFCTAGVRGPHVAMALET